MASAPWYAPAFLACLYDWSESCADADSDPCRYYSKPAFYIFLPGFELIILGMYAVTRVDRMFYALGRHEQLLLEPREEYEMNQERNREFVREI